MPDVELVHRHSSVDWHHLLLCRFSRLHGRFQRRWRERGLHPGKCHYHRTEPDTDVDDNSNPHNHTNSNTDTDVKYKCNSNRNANVNGYSYVDAEPDTRSYPLVEVY